MTTQADKIYLELLQMVLQDGDGVTTRNSECYSHFNLPNVTFTEFPLVTLRKTAAMKSIKEMEWFLSGEAECPTELLDWWSGQLDEFNNLINGYSIQFRHSTSYMDNESTLFDQVEFIHNALKTNPNSRRLVMSVWNPGEMADIVTANNNPNTPTCCHSIVVQFFVRSGHLHMKTYQRSADMLLGVPHNWAQSWAMLMYFAKHSGLEVGSMTWMWGDAHIYKEQSHLDTVNQLLNTSKDLLGHPISLVYSNTSEEFSASDFKISGIIPDPVVTIRPKLL